MVMDLEVATMTEEYKELLNAPKIAMLLFTQLTQNNYKKYVIGITMSDNTVFKNDFSSEEHENINKYRLELVKNIKDKTLEGFAYTKYYLEKLFLEVTERGFLEFYYQEDYLLTSMEMQKKLNVSRATLSRFVANGMETVQNKKHGKYPAHNAIYWKTTLWVARIQTLKTQLKIHNLTEEALKKELTEEVAELEKKYGGKFEDVFAKVLNGDMDEYELDEPEDFIDWRDALEELEEMKE